MENFEVLTVFDKDHKKVGVIDRYSSLIWVRKFQDAGEFELVLPWRSLYTEILQPFYYIERQGGKTAGGYREEMIIEKISVEQSAEDGIVMTVYGRNLTSILSRRIIYSVDANSSIQPGTYTAFGWISALVNECFGENALPPRRILNAEGETGFSMHDLTGDTDTRVRACEASVCLLDVIRDFCCSQGYGIEILYGSDDYGIYVYKADDKSSSVIFSQKLDNLANIIFENDYTEFGNVARVSPDGQSYVTAPLGADSTKDSSFTGLDRHETVISAELASAALTI
ncbi:MAG: hypothetical protein ACI4JB_07785 [Porcipelethomonas sp.]